MFPWPSGAPRPRGKSPSGSRRGRRSRPVRIEGRTIASTFWGRAWCTNLESYSDFANRLPRGRTYVRNGSVVHLKIDKGRIEALVSGSELYEIQIDIAALPKPAWQALKKQSAGKIGTLVELLQGKLSKARDGAGDGSEQGLFPKPKEIKMRCSCPDYAGMCKHLAAVMYGVGNRLDSSPELLFVLRGVDHLELIEQAIPTAPIRANEQRPHDRGRRPGSHLRYRDRRRSCCQIGHQHPREAGAEEGREEGRSRGRKRFIREKGREEGRNGKGRKNPIGEESLEEGGGPEGEEGPISLQERLAAQIVSRLVGGIGRPPIRPRAATLRVPGNPRLARHRHLADMSRHFFSASPTNSNNAFVTGSSGRPRSALILL